MILFLFTNIFLLLFYIFMLIYSYQIRSVTVFLANMVGVLAAALALALDITDLQTKGSLIALWIIVVAILVFDLINLIGQIRKDANRLYERPDIWRRVMNDREYKMIFSETIFQEDLEKRNDVGMTEKLQALEMWRLGNKAFFAGHYDDAMEKYDLSIRWCPTSVSWINKSGIFFERGEYDRVIECCDEAIKLNPDREEAWLNRGLAFMARKDPNKALKSFEEALVVNPNNPETLTLRGNAYRRLGKLEESLASYSKANDVAPEYLNAWFQKGITLGMLGRLEEAIECFSQAIKLDKSFAPAYYHLANALNKLDRNEEAIEYYRKALKLQPEFHEAWNNLGIALTKAGQVKQAIKSYQKAIALKPDYQEAWLNCALANESVNRIEEAVRCYEKFLEIAPDSLAKHKAIAQKHLEEIKREWAARENSKGKKHKEAEAKQEQTNPTPEPLSENLNDADL